VTILNFALAQDAVYLVTDTLVSDPVDMGPLFFTAKVFPAPHWQGLICGTGVQQFIVEWYCTAITSILAIDMKHLDEFVPDMIRPMYQQYQFDQDREITSTIYHIGLDRSERRFVAFAYRSTNDFVGEPLEYGIHLKPDPEDASMVFNHFPADFITIAEMQKLEDETKPMVERVGIGGDLISYMMQIVDVNGQPETQMAIVRCHKFPDTDAMYQSACSRLPVR
jgi:hypothetical protein